MALMNHKTCIEKKMTVFRNDVSYLYCIQYSYRHFIVNHVFSYELYL